MLRNARYDPKQVVSFSDAEFLRVEAVRLLSGRDERIGYPLIWVHGVNRWLILEIKSRKTLNLFCRAMGYSNGLGVCVLVDDNVVHLSIEVCWVLFDHDLADHPIIPHLSVLRLISFVLSSVVMELLLLPHDQSDLQYR